MEKKLKTHPKASLLVQTPQKALPRKTQSVVISCPPQQITALPKQDHQSKTEKMVCLGRRPFPNKSFPVYHKTESLQNHDDKIKDKCKLPSPYPDHHGVYIRPDLKCKTTDSIDIFQCGDASMSPNQNFSLDAMPKGQAKVKHGPHHKAKYTLGSKQQTKSKLPPQHHPKNQVTSLPFIYQPDRIPSHCQSPTKNLLINTPPDPDCQTIPTTPKLMNTSPDPDCQTIPTTPKLMTVYPALDFQTTPTIPRLMNIYPSPDCQAIPIIVKYNQYLEVPPFCNMQDILPPNIYHQAPMPLDKEEYSILPRFLGEESKDSTKQYYQKRNHPSPMQFTEIPTSDYNQAEDASDSDQSDEAQLGNQYQTQTEQNRDTPRCLNDTKPYTIEGPITLNTQIVDKIVSSIPEEKIKRDIYNQVCLWQRKGCPRPTHCPGHYIYASYTICLICASWVPYGCPHVHEMKCSSLAQLLAIPTPLPDSEKKNMRFYLKLPQQKPNTISAVTESFTAKVMPSSHSLVLPSRPKSDPIPLGPSKFTWLDYIFAKSHQPKEENSCPNQKRLELPLTSKITNEMPVRQRTQFKSLLDKFQSRRDN
ncbi:uncharacterized protein LOC141521113 [Macrotis lagotis]|uniref:uncharacterized protein LOC141521113 n=1 Tax=Macrotis lagotis TaxID=92651 RepID=UPI003D6849EC